MDIQKVIHHDNSAVQPPHGPLFHVVRNFVILQYRVNITHYLQPFRMTIKYELEYPINCSPKILYNRLSTPDGLAEWFADDVNLRGNVFSFMWGSSEEMAEVVQRKENKYIRFHWLDDDDDQSYFEFRITQDEMTGDVSLLIVDFAEKDEKSDAVDLWDSQIAELKHVIGL